jgi:hypothetical protein
MPSVKKKRLVFRIVGKDEAIAALEIYAYVQGKRLQGLGEVSYQHYKPIIEFKQTYGHSYEDTIAELWKWKSYIFLKHRDASPIDAVYEIYAEYVTPFDKEPTKWKLLNAPINIDWGEWVFKGNVYEVKGLYSDDEIKLLILEDFDKERRNFEKLKVKFKEAPSEDVTYERPRIPEGVRIEVWRRDGGKCARCGSREKLEYDHIVPISKGGSNTARNIELLCEKCNRSKSNNVV